VLFELGLFIGGLGLARVFIVVDRSAALKLPSDLAGITPATFAPPTAGNMQSAAGAACTAIEAKIKKLGRRYINGVTAHWWTGCLEDGANEDPDFFMTVANQSHTDLPWLNVHVFPSNDFRLEPVQGQTERLMAGQYAVYRFRMLEGDGRLSKWAQKFAKLKRKELSIRVFKDRTANDPLMIDYELGAELYDRIQRFKKEVAGN
jgi:hypothetical protein